MSSELAERKTKTLHDSNPPAGVREAVHDPEHNSWQRSQVRYVEKYNFLKLLSFVLLISRSYIFNTM